MQIALLLILIHLTSCLAFFTEYCKLFANGQYMRYDGSYLKMSSWGSFDLFYQYTFVITPDPMGTATIGNYGGDINSGCPTYTVMTSTPSTSQVTMQNQGNLPPGTIHNWNVQPHSFSYREIKHYGKSLRHTEPDGNVELHNNVNQYLFFCADWMVIWNGNSWYDLLQIPTQGKRRKRQITAHRVAITAYTYYLGDKNNRDRCNEHIAVTLKDNRNCFLSCEPSGPRGPAKGGTGQRGRPGVVGGPRGPNGPPMCHPNQGPIFAKSCYSHNGVPQRNVPSKPDHRLWIAQREPSSRRVFFRCHSDPRYVLVLFNGRLSVARKMQTHPRRLATANLASFPSSLQPTVSHRILIQK